MNFVGQDELVEAFFEGHYFADIFIVLLVVILGIFGLFLIVRIMLGMYEPLGFNSLDFHDKMKLTYSVVNVTVLGVFVVPYTHGVYNMLYGPNFLEYLLDNYRVLYAYALMHGILYIVEVGSDIVIDIKRKKLLLVHHCLWFGMLLLAISTHSIFLFKVDFVLDVFVTYECGLFLALLVRRLTLNSRIRKKFILAGCIVFGVSRILQAAVLIHLFACSAGRMLQDDAKQYAIFFSASIGSFVLVVIQLYTIRIHYMLYTKEVRVEREQCELDKTPATASIPGALGAVDGGTHTPSSATSMPAVRWHMSDGESVQRMQSIPSTLASSERSRPVSLHEVGRSVGVESWHMGRSVGVESWHMTTVTYWD